MYTVIYIKNRSSVPSTMTVQAKTAQHAEWIVKHLGYTVILVK